MTWDDVRAFVAGATGMSLVRDEGDQVTVRMGEQRIVLELAAAFDEPWLVVMAPIAAQEQVRHCRDALELNGRFAIGALALVGDVLVLRSASSLASLDGAVLSRTLGFVAREAARLFAIHGRMRVSDSTLDHFAD